MTGNSIIYGDRTFTNLDVKEGRTTSERSPIGDVLTIDTLEFDVVSEDTTLTDFIRNTPLTFFHDDEQMGIFYVQKNQSNVHQHLSFRLHIDRRFA